jgi:hypothetical protein
MNHRIYECGICGEFHPWHFNGDCRDDENRFPTPEDYAESTGYSIWDVEVLSMEDRVAADYGDVGY